MAIDALKRPTVSVCCITYNHSAFLAQAIDSVLLQETEFDVEMVIGEDCSSDDTRAIAQDYAQRFPGRIRVLTPPHNLGVMPNLLATIAACTGEFIAFLEGDDYWIDPKKLQLQVDALRANPDCGMCVHDAETFRDEDGGIEWTFGYAFRHILPPFGAEYKRFDQLSFARYGWFLPSASMLIRSTSIPLPLPAWVAGVYSGDYTLQLLSTRHGPALYIPRVMSRYRIHDNGIGNIMVNTPGKFERRIFEAKMYQKHVFRPKDKKHADIYLAMQYQNYARFLGEQGQPGKKLKYQAASWRYNWQRIPLYLERLLARRKSGADN